MPRPAPAGKHSMVKSATASGPVDWGIYSFIGVQLKSFHNREQGQLRNGNQQRYQMIVQQYTESEAAARRRFSHHATHPGRHRQSNRLGPATWCEPDRSRQPELRRVPGYTDVLNANMCRTHLFRTNTKLPVSRAAKGSEEVKQGFRRGLTGSDPLWGQQKIHFVDLNQHPEEPPPGLPRRRSGRFLSISNRIHLILSQYAHSCSLDCVFQIRFHWRWTHNSNLFQKSETVRTVDKWFMSHTQSKSSDLAKNMISSWFRFL